MSISIFTSSFISLLRSTSLALFLLCVLTSLAHAYKPTTPAKVVPVRLVIPRIHLDSPVTPVGRKPVVVEGKTYAIWETVDNEVGWHNLSASPGQQGNTVLSGHSDIKARVFRNLENVQKGDEIQVFSGENPQPYRYEVTETVVVKEKGVPVNVRLRNARWIAPTEDERLTLVTCAYPGATHRLIVIARPLVESISDS